MPDVSQQLDSIINKLTSSAKGAVKNLPITQLFTGGVPAYKESLKKSAEQFKDPMTALNFLPVAGTTKPIIKQIDNLTKDEMIKAIDYIRLALPKKQFNQGIELNIGKLAEKFGIRSRRYGMIANQFENLVEKTKTKDVSGRMPLFKVEKLK